LSDEANRLHEELGRKNAELIRLFNTYGRQEAPLPELSPFSRRIVALSDEVRELVLKARDADSQLVPLLSVDEGKLNVINNVAQLEKTIRAYNL